MPQVVGREQVQQRDERRRRRIRALRHRVQDLADRPLVGERRQDRRRLSRSELRLVAERAHQVRELGRAARPPAGSRAPRRRSRRRPRATWDRWDPRPPRACATTARTAFAGRACEASSARRAFLLRLGNLARDARSRARRAHAPAGPSRPASRRAARSARPEARPGNRVLLLGDEALDRVQLDVLEAGLPEQGHDVVLVLPDAGVADREHLEQPQDLVPLDLGTDGQAPARRRGTCGRRASARGRARGRPPRSPSSSSNGRTSSARVPATRSASVDLRAQVLEQPSGSRRRGGRRAGSCAPCGRWRAGRRSPRGRRASRRAGPPRPARVLGSSATLRPIPRASPLRRDDSSGRAAQVHVISARAGASAGYSTSSSKSVVLPAVRLGPVEGEDDAGARGELLGRKVGQEQAQLRVEEGVSWTVCQPSVLQWTIAGASAVTRSILPAGIDRHFWLKRQIARGEPASAADVALDRLGRHVEDAAVAQRPAQLDVLGVRPHQRHGRAGGPAEEQLALGNVRRVPDLLGDQAALVGEGLQRAAAARARSRVARPPARSGRARR